MSASTLSWWAVMMRPGALQGSAVVQADRYERRGNSEVFICDEAVVHTFGVRDVVRVVGFEHQRPASEAIKAHRRSLVGGATTHIAESTVVTAHGGKRRRKGAAPTTARAVGLPAEGLSIRIDER